jgi:signal transduction histidine kinase
MTTELRKTEIEMVGGASWGTRIYDITERVRAERALQVSQQLTHAILNSFSAYICILDETGIIVAMNMEDFAGANSAIMDKVCEGVNYLHMCEATQGEERQIALTFAAGIRAVIQGQRAHFEFEHPCRSPQEQCWYIGRVTPLVGSPATRRRVVVTHVNITAYKQLEAENEQLAFHGYEAQKMETIGRLTQEIAHDFNNLLVPIITFAELALLKLVPNSHLYADFKRIKKAGERAARLARQLLIVSRQ